MCEGDEKKMLVMLLVRVLRKKKSEVFRMRRPMVGHEH